MLRESPLCQQFQQFHVQSIYVTREPMEITGTTTMVERTIIILFNALVGLLIVNSVGH